MNETITERLSFFIKSQGLTHIKFAESIGLKKTTFSNKIQGSRSIDINMLEKILEVYPNLNMNWLISGAGNMEVSLRITDTSIIEMTEKMDAISKQNQEIMSSFEHLKKKLNFFIC